MWLHRSLVKCSYNKRLLKNECQTLFKYCSTYLGSWQQPQGTDSGIKVYNSAVNKKVPLFLRNEGIATWYMCGPTVYAESHLGHASSYVKFDIIRRIMEMCGINVLLMMGITDVDDKIIKKSYEMGISISEVSKKYEFEFFRDLEALKVKSPSFVSRVTENISLIISFCERLIEKDYAYVTNEGSVYFMVSKSTSSNITSDMSDLPDSVIDPSKKDKRDFALWKASKPNEPYWISPWGKGRPGWHIECSAMASKVFGSHLDIHSGGIDLLFPHHCNEKSQSEAYHDSSQWVNYWLHAGLLHAEGEEKMSKSIKNTISIADFLKENSTNDFRIMCLQSLYRKNISYSAETLAGAKGLHNKFHNFLNDAEFHIHQTFSLHPADEEKLLQKLIETKNKLEPELRDDFHTSQALLLLTDLIDECNKYLQVKANSPSCVMSFAGNRAVIACSNYVDYLLEILGVSIICKKKLKQEFVYAIDVITEFRNQVRLCALCLTENNETPLNHIKRSHQQMQENIEIVYKHVPPTFTPFKNCVALLYTQASDFAQDLKNYANGETLKEKRKHLAPLLMFCDMMRTSFQSHGIALKDTKTTSFWMPLMDLNATYLKKPI